MRLVFSRCALTQRHLTWELKQNTCEPCNASTTYDVCKTSVGSVYVGGYGGPRESRLCVFHELCSVSFLVDGESLSVLL